MKIAVVGATGLVGSVMIKVLEEQNLPISQLIPVASAKSIGKRIIFKGKEIDVMSAQDAIDLKPHIALFSAGATASAELAPKFAAAGCRVIDNSSYWRQDPNIKLIIPEVNGETITGEEMIIANPNCSTIQMLVALAPIHKHYGIKRVVVSTYQSVTGSGQKGIDQLSRERGNSIKNGSAADHSSIVDVQSCYPAPIDRNVIPQIDSFTPDGYTKEELKMINETHKIMADSSIRITATTVRVPVEGGHSESVNVELNNPFDIDDIRNLLQQSPGVVVEDNPQKQQYPMPINAWGKDDVFVGRIRRDNSLEHGINMWIVADNLRKGAATNAVQIAMTLASKIGFFINFAQN